jgi:hypothetical protein
MVKNYKGGRSADLFRERMERGKMEKDSEI